jgi:hypothetical protein
MGVVSAQVSMSRIKPDAGSIPEIPIGESLIGLHALQAMAGKALSMPPGCFVEVGVYRGGSARHLATIALVQDRRLFLYDTFEGLPYKADIDQEPVGRFADTSVEEVRRLIPDSHVQIVKGVFPASAVPMPAVAFVHLDCDQYQAITESVRYLWPMMVEGGVIWFDDPFALDGATLALNDLFAEAYIRIDADCNKAYVVNDGGARIK